MANFAWKIKIRNLGIEKGLRKQRDVGNIK